MSEKLQRAVQRVKKGDRVGAQQLLAEILACEPDNEHAWMWLSAVLSGDQLRYCIRQALRINPNNPQARRACEVLGLDMRELHTTHTQTEAVTVTPASQGYGDAYHKGQKGSVKDETGDAFSEPTSVEIERSRIQEPALTYWVYSARGAINLIALDGVRLLRASIPSRHRKQVIEGLEKDLLLESLLQDKVEAAFEKMTEVSQYQRRLEIKYLENGKTRLIRLSCAGERMSAAILNVLGRKLGPRFERRYKPVSFNAKIMATFILFIMTAALTAILFFGAIEIASGNISLPIGRRTASLVGTVGPIGVLGIGGVLMLIMFISMIVQSKRPPKMTKLALD